MGMGDKAMENLLSTVANELCTNLFAAEVGSDLEAEITQETLKRRLLPLLKAGQALASPYADHIDELIADYKAALQAAKEQP